MPLQKPQPLLIRPRPPMIPPTPHLPSHPAITNTMQPRSAVILQPRLRHCHDAPFANDMSNTSFTSSANRTMPSSTRLSPVPRTSELKMPKSTHPTPCGALLRLATNFHRHHRPSHNKDATWPTPSALHSSEPGSKYLPT